MAIISSSKRIINSCRQLSYESIISAFASIGIIFMGAFLTPFAVRWIVIPSTVTHSQPVDFTFNTCADQLHGVCSFPEAVVDLDQAEQVLSPGYYYTFSLDIQLLDTRENKQLGMFQAQVAPQDSSGLPMAVYKKTVMFRQSFFSKVYTFIRNIIFFPLYMIGYFPSFDTTKSITLTDHFYESYDRPTKLLSLQLQHRLIQVSSADFHIRAHVGISSYLLFNYPTITSIIIFGTAFAIYSGIFLVCWSRMWQSDDDIDEDDDGLKED